MMNPFYFVLTIILMAFVFTIVKHKMGIRSQGDGIVMDNITDNARNDEENASLRAQVKQMQDRIRVLERIVTDRGVETAAQIEALREHDGMPE
jgi:hypothetical protein